MIIYNRSVCECVIFDDFVQSVDNTLEFVENGLLLHMQILIIPLFNIVLITGRSTGRSSNTVLKTTVLGC